MSLAGRGDTAGGAGRDYGGGSGEEAVMRGAAVLCKALLKHEYWSNSHGENSERVVGDICAGGKYCEK